MVEIVKHAKNFFKGMAIGLATLVPGASGGTMAIILGVYDKMIHAISSFFKDWKRHTVFLVELGLGAALGILLFSRLLESAIERYPAVMQYLFMGLIIGGLPTLYKKSTTSRKTLLGDLIFFVLGFVIVLLMTSEPQAIVNMATARGFLSMVFLFLAGIIIAIALVLPVISGSFMLLALGLYNLTLHAINEFNIPFLASIGLGIATGVLGTTKIIEKMLQKYPSKTYMLIIGFVTGSLISVFPGIPPMTQIFACAVSFALGVAAILFLGKYDIEY